ncbi:hypothetical protein GCM10023189_36280 [Nibrella saemangeumensis]|uniref:Secreted protein n=1 Tax=Nibrella saemangeumensis TaxID=1084526 RepID=A0ABP8N6Z0_9BACT
MCGVLARIIVTYAYICFSSRSTMAHATTSPPLECSPTINTLVRVIHIFGAVLDARLLSMPAPLDQ